MLAANAACAAGPGRAAREEARRLTCPLERVGRVKNFSGRPVDVFAGRLVPEGERAKPSELLRSVNPGETVEFALGDSVVLGWQDPTNPTNPNRLTNVHDIAASGSVQVTYVCRRFGEGPPAPRG
jgi:hypothetical protein